MGGTSAGFISRRVTSHDSFMPLTLNKCSFPRGNATISPKDNHIDSKIHAFDVLVPNRFSGDYRASPKNQIQL
jgi:hypothetical protein